ncbi:class I SAM-dependent methyltransferase [Congregibacter litoralis]|uniref:2-polyprenyl-3-methyl-5-hydroxy-6-metoxy-1, 4-benzoquinol methylase n=1 Tax=Congregibacter litoralis KT71 TaxID=314285 RepID=A4ABL8_9GAMM|nr:class I SAM-dependent methyltransferase [Congregibacter litoralis]EAQ96531.1 2-polyprenyl-3-methyl-5-hydroxy-6-metoxy-1,4-benzoquinol methylase [Congregibacter litoralis KT71]
MSREEQRVALQATLYASRNPTRRYLHCARRDWVLAQLRELGSQGSIKQALELGPGSGVYLPALSQLAQRVVALDVEPGHLRAAKHLLAAEGEAVSVGFVQGDLRSGILQGGSVDLLLCSEVIEHVADSAGLLKAMAGALSPQGTLILTTPQPLSPVELLGKIAFLPGIIHLLRLVYREPVEPTGHINLLSAAQLKTQCTAAGFVVRKQARMGFYLPILGEFGGNWGQRFLAAIDRKLQGSRFEAVLWTQCYLLRKADGAVHGSAQTPSDVAA